MPKIGLLLVGLICWIGAGLALSHVGKGHRGLQIGPSQVHRIVSLAPDITEILFALDLGDRVVGVTQFSDYPPEALLKPRVGSFWAPNVEAIWALRPDLVVTAGFAQHRVVADRLSRLGCRCLGLRMERIEDVFLAVDAVGCAAGCPQRAVRWKADMNCRLERIRASVGFKTRPRVLWVVQREPLRVAGPGTFIDQIIDLAGGMNAMGPTIYDYPPIGSEQLVACMPEVIIEPAMTGSDAGAQEQARRYWGRWSMLPAVASQRVYLIDPGPVSRLGPRLVEGVEQVQRCLGEVGRGDR